MKTFLCGHEQHHLWSQRPAIDSNILNKNLQKRVDLNKFIHVEEQQGTRQEDNKHNKAKKMTTWMGGNGVL